MFLSAFYGVEANTVTLIANLNHIKGDPEAFIYNVAFSDRSVNSKGEIFNCTDNENNIECNEKDSVDGTQKNSALDTNNRSFSQPHKVSKESNSKSYFRKETIFHAVDADNRLVVKYNPDGTCYIDGYIRDEECWLRATSEGRYYIKNSIIYVTWDEWVNESYKLENNRYNDNGLIYKVQK